MKSLRSLDGSTDIILGFRSKRHLSLSDEQLQGPQVISDTLTHTNLCTDMMSNTDQRRPESHNQKRIKLIEKYFSFVADYVHTDSSGPTAGSAQSPVS